MLDETPEVIDLQRNMIRQLFLGWWCSLHYTVFRNEPTIEEEVDTFLDLGQKIENVTSG